MEKAVVNLMAKTTGIAVTDVLDWVVPAEQLALLRAASPYAELHSSNFSSDQMRSVVFPFGKVTFYLDFVHMGCIPPCKSLINIQPNASKASELRAIVETVARITTQHAKLRHILRVFTSLQVTPGAARHYFPTLQSLLPSDHAFFSVKGDRFRNVFFDHETTEYLREAPEIIARGLLCDPRTNGKDKPGRELVRVQINSVSHQVFSLFNKEAA
jgi:hypothetical protein